MTMLLTWVEVAITHHYKFIKHHQLIQFYLINFGLILKDLKNKVKTGHSLDVLWEHCCWICCLWLFCIQLVLKLFWHIFMYLFIIILPLVLSLHHTSSYLFHAFFYLPLNGPDKGSSRGTSLRSFNENCPASGSQTAFGLTLQVVFLLSWQLLARTSTLSLTYTDSFGHLFWLPFPFPVVRLPF